MASGFDLRASCRNHFLNFRFLAVVLNALGCVTTQPPTTQTLSFNLPSSEIAKQCAAARSAFDEKLNTLENLSKESWTFSQAARPFDWAFAEFMDRSEPLIFLKYVSTDKHQRASASDCETAYEQATMDVYGRAKLHGILSHILTNSSSLNPDEVIFLRGHLKEFERNGLVLEPEKRRQFLQKKKKLIEITSAFSSRLNSWQDSLWITEKELEGLSSNFISSLKMKDGLHEITLSYPHFYTFMESAKNAEARKKLYFKFSNRGAPENTKLLDEALVIRHELANLLGYPTHASFVLSERMAGTPAAVQTFLGEIRKKLITKGKEDLELLRELKRSELGLRGPVSVYAWDWLYYENLLKKERYQIDLDEVKDYFPLDVVTKGMFDIYQTLLGVSFEPSTDLPLWHKDVALYAVKESGRIIAYFYLDLFPRPNKYGHAAAFTLHRGYEGSHLRYKIPVSAVVANFNPPTDKIPSLLSHGEVQTHFHEFGHIMHQILTKARFAAQSGTSVRRDFVEAPSQMLENWVWKKEALARMSGHYLDPRRKLPSDILDKLIDAKLANVGMRYLRQIFLATIDLQYHSTRSPDTTALYRKSIEDIMMIPIPDGVEPQASFGHLMSTYDAGYYGYLWSKVFAEDMFTRFEKEGLLNPQTGRDYRRCILEPGGSQEPFRLISNFLGREPNQQAFLKSIGLL